MSTTLPNLELERALDCIDLFYARMFREWPTAVTQTEPHFTLSYSGDTRLTGANHLWPHGSAPLDEDAIHTAASFFRPYRAAWSVIITDTHMPDTLELLREQGFFVRWQSPLMALEGPPAPLSINPTVTVRRAQTFEDLHHVRRVMTEAFATPAAVNERVVRSQHLDDAQVAHYLISVEGDPACCASVACRNGMVGVWNVGTRVRYRRQRMATTLMRALLDDLYQQGISDSMLMATRVGQPLYAALGYRVIGQTLYMGPPLYNRRPARLPH